MSNFWLRDPDCVLIHLPKTAGTSIRKGVWQQRYDGPVFGHIPDDWQHLFKFAFVRHPFDRLISAWQMFASGTSRTPAPKVTRDISLEAFCDIVCDDTIIYDERRSTAKERIRHHAIPQTHVFNCLEHAEFVGRFESLDSDFARVCDILGRPMTLPHMHSTSHGPWQDYFTPSLVSRMAGFYAGDFEALGYDDTL